jgi:hypothetical protein
MNATNETCLTPLHAVFTSRPWRPDRSARGDVIWFDHFNQNLYLDFHTSCGTCLQIGSWERGLPISRWNEVMEYWEPETSDVGLPLSLKTDELTNKKNRSAMQDFVSGIPAEVVAVVAPFVWRQMILLSMIRQNRDILELVTSNPVLAWLLADTIAEREIPIGDGCQLIYRKRREILGFIGGPATDSAVNTLANLRFDTYLQETCTNIKSVIKNPAWLAGIKGLKSVPRIVFSNIPKNLDVIRWLAGTQTCDGENDWDRVIRDPGALFTALRIWRDSIQTGIALQIAEPVRCVKQCRSMAALVRLHDAWADRLNAIENQTQIDEMTTRYGTTRFPDPPLQGTPEIIPITTITELIEEGREMHNCVVSYAEQIMKSGCYIYRVLSPERATLEVCNDNGLLLPRQLKAECNRDVSMETRHLVEQWILAGEAHDETSGHVRVHDDQQESLTGAF